METNRSFACEEENQQIHFLNAESQKLQLIGLLHCFLLKYTPFEASLPNSNPHTGTLKENACEHKQNIHHSLRERQCSHLQRFIKFWVGTVTFNFGLAFTLAGLIRQKVCFDISADQVVHY